MNTFYQFQIMSVRTFYCLIFLLVFSVNVRAETDSVQRLENIQAEIKSLTESLNETKKSRAELHDQLEKQSKVISTLNRSLLDSTGKLKIKNNELDKLKKDKQKYHQSHARQLDALAKQLRSAYLNTSPNYLKVLLSQHEPSSLSRTSAYYAYFHQARQQQLIEISANLKTLTHNRQILLIAQQQHQALYQEQQLQQQLLQKIRQQRFATAKQLDHKMEKQGVRVTSLQGQERALKFLLQSLSKKSTPLILDLPFSMRKGTLAWPTQGKIIARYGSSRNLGKLTWQGLMINAPLGEEIISTAPGRVVFSDWLRGFGLLLIIDHGDKYMTLYGNNQSLLKKAGDSVATGDMIALSGEQGIRQYTGLYFELRYKGNPTDPLKWLSKSVNNYSRKKL
jgi:septal ring factor EnvC (AmiA/AmiB activator)